MTTTDVPELRHLPGLHRALAAVVLLAAIALAVPVYAGWQALAHPELHGDSAAGRGLAPPSLGGWSFLVGGGAAVALGVGLAVALAVSGRAIALRRGHTFCLATSFAASFFFPLGTLLGFHTIDVLCAPAVRAAFGVPPPPVRPERS